MVCTILKKHPSVPVVGLQFEAVTLLFFLMRMYYPKVLQLSKLQQVEYCLYAKYNQTMLLCPCPSGFPFQLL